MTDERNDQHLVGELVARYVEAVALFDESMYRSVWAPHAVWVVDSRGEFAGPDAITELFATLRRRQEFAVQRIVSGRSRCGATAGRGRWIIHSLTRTNGVGQELVGIYDDDYVRTDGDWLFERRTFHPLYRGAIALEGKVFAPPSLAAL
jgi:hypothetical protein